MNLIKVFKNKKNIKIFSFLVIIITFLFFLFKNINTSLYIFKINLFTSGEKINLFFLSLFDLSELKSLPLFIMILLFIFSLALFFLLTILLYKESKKINNKKGFLNTFFIFISILGLSCASCGIGLLASIFSFFGISYLISYFPLQGVEIGYLGIIFLNISNYFLLKRLKSPNIC